MALVIGPDPFEFIEDLIEYWYTVCPSRSFLVSSSADEVCLQVLELTANLGGGRMAYRVADAYCDSLPQALCFSGCVGTIDDVIIGIDIIHEEVWTRLF